MPDKRPKQSRQPCELAVDPAKRTAALIATEPLKKAFPPGMSQPSLRALASVGIARLEDLTKFSEAQLRQLHGMGPKALSILALALKQKGKSFRSPP